MIASFHPAADFFFEEVLFSAAVAFFEADSSSFAFSVAAAMSSFFYSPLLDFLRYISFLFSLQVVEMDFLTLSVFWVFSIAVPWVISTSVPLVTASADL